MPITITHGPASLVGALAIRAGQSEASRLQHQYDLESARLSVQAQAEANRVAAERSAFKLQEAMADRIAMNQRNSPFTKMVEEQLAEKQKTGENQPGIPIETKQPQAPKPRLTGAKEIDLILRPFREKRRILEDQLRGINKADELSMDPATKQKKQAEFQQAIDDLFTQEDEALKQWQMGGEAPPPGAITITAPERQPRNESERNVVEYLRSQGLSPGPSWEPKTTTVGEFPPAPPREQREVGKLYQLPIGKVGRWTGEGWEVQ